MDGIKKKTMIYKLLFTGRLSLAFFCVVILSFNGLAQNNKKTDKLFEEARSCYQADNNAKTIESCNKILKIDESHTSAHLLLAEVYMNIDSTRLEIFHLDKASYTSTNSLIDFRLAEAFYKLGMYSEALSFYEKYGEANNIPEKRQFLVACKLASCRFAINSIENPVDFEPTNLGDEVPMMSIGQLHLLMENIWFSRA